MAPVPGIALGWVWRLGPRAVQPADGGLLPPDVGGALGEGERFDPVGHSSAEQQTIAAPLPRRLSGSLPQQYCGRCTLVKIPPISTRPWRGDERKWSRSQNQQNFLIVSTDFKPQINSDQKQNFPLTKWTLHQISIPKLVYYLKEREVWHPALVKTRSRPSTRTWSTRTSRSTRRRPRWTTISTCFPPR